MLRRGGGRSSAIGRGTGLSHRRTHLGCQPRPDRGPAGKHKGSVTAPPPTPRMDGLQQRRAATPPPREATGGPALLRSAPPRRPLPTSRSRSRPSPPPAPWWAQAPRRSARPLRSRRLRPALCAVRRDGSRGHPARPRPWEACASPPKGPGRRRPWRGEPGRAWGDSGGATAPVAKRLLLPWRRCPPWLSGGLLPRSGTRVSCSQRSFFAVAHGAEVT